MVFPGMIKKSIFFLVIVPILFIRRILIGTLMHMAQSCEQMEMPLYEQRSFEDLLAQKGIFNLAVSFNPRMKNGWRMKIHSLSGRRDLYVPAYFENAPEKVKEAIIEWALLCPLKKRGKQPVLRERKKMLERVVMEFITASGKAHGAFRRIPTGGFRSKGRLYDLREIFQSLNASYFGGKLSSHIRWGKSRGRSYQTTFTDGHGQRQNLISIALLYNAPDVPRFAVEGIVFHEMLHIAVPPYKRDFKNIIHGREFKRAERSFPHFMQWRQWERQRLK